MKLIAAVVLLTVAPGFCLGAILVVCGMRVVKALWRSA